MSKRPKSTTVIPEDLQNQWQAAQACSTALALFDQGCYSPRHIQFIKPTMAFLGKLHEQTVEQALAHPQAHMIPELKEAMKKRTAKTKAEVKDGQAATAN